MPLRSGLEAIVILLYCRGSKNKLAEPIRGITKLDKLLYLAVKETAIGLLLDKELEFEAYDYGPYSSQVYDAIETLKDAGLVAVGTEPCVTYDEVSDADLMDREVATEQESIPLKRTELQVYRLSESGMKAGSRLFELLTPEEREGICSIKKKFNAAPLKHLIEYVYKNYPESTVKSKIRKTILGQSRFGSRPNMKPFIREEEDFRM